MSRATDSVSLERWFVSWAETAQATQEVFDAAHAESLTAFEVAKVPLAAIDPSLVSELAPPQQHVQEMSCEQRVQLSVDRSVGFEVGLEPLGSIFERRFSTSTQQASTLKVSVVPVFRDPRQPTSGES